MKLQTIGLAFCAVVILAGCKSKELTSAIIHNQTGRYDLAIETAGEEVARNPTNAEAHFQLGIAYSNLDSTTLSFEHFMKAKEYDPSENRAEMVENNVQSNFARHYNLALNLQKEEDWAGAADEFKRATECDPRQAKGYFQLGRVYALMAADDPSYYDKAIPVLDRVLELSTPAEKHYIDALSLAGEVLALSGRPEEAVVRFSRLVEEDPTNYRVIEKIGYERLDAEDWDGAAVFLDLAAQARAKIGAEDFNLYYNIGVAHFQQRKDDPAAVQRAIDYYQRALEVQPNEPTTMRNIVLAFVVSEDWPDAVTWGEKYITVNPDDGDGWRLLSRAYTGIGDSEKARRCLQRFEQISEGQ